MKKIIPFIILALGALIAMFVMSSCEKESNNTTLKIEITPVPNREHVIFPGIVHFNDVRDTFRYILIEPFGYSFEYVIPSKHYYFEYTLDTGLNAKKFRLYENGKLIESIDKHGQVVIVNK